uniref:histone-lysine N-methyltransferase SETDB1-A-like n=1 Tax=Monopterus albus TaxID=43700 RepID=UPI0009B48A1D|nr:histone-lysine N-methyltransferase SETDB1-A-like [Monopterus albus]XP_020441692.1 histone-lysine N-methyltransferase SETDB1-A-like [Monopterus albus]XP_020441693.1 histone-lysine N-methyltransferase SETDB1-A-like [Monopterus albus]XP_020441694.1 histone-lysine N-methyltransferase SETDB1-A-like [Monopterus albus]XP_020441695.1 histone-lysine N-methyltransferase SETDB1-A-like [Monopterus albus]
MEGDEMEMSKDEIQNWIREEVQNSDLISPDVLERCRQLQSLLEKREKQAICLMKLCKSVAACEAVVKKQYSLLGLEYRDTDSDDDNIADCGNTPRPSCDSVDFETHVRCTPATKGHTPLLPKQKDTDKINGDNGTKRSASLIRKPVVVLTRLPQRKIDALCQLAPVGDDSEHESLISMDSDMQWEPEDDSSDSDFSESSFKTGSKRRRKIDTKKEKLFKNLATPQTRTNTSATSDAAETSSPQANADSDAKSSTEKTPVPQASTKTLTAPGNTNGLKPACIASVLSKSTDETTRVVPTMPPGEINVNMYVLARKKAMNWQRGKLVEILTKEDGRVKYKVIFDEKGKSLVSGHHIAFDIMPKLGQLYIGARVVVKSQGDQPQFCPGILAELPSRKNRMRFLVFVDDHVPVYVGLPLLHLVCRPLTDPLEDIEDDAHRKFMRQYLKVWPFPPVTQYRQGQQINAELNGTQQMCEVLTVDCSLIEVVFQKDQHKEWIYRGSMRLEYMINMMEHLESKKEERDKKN